MSRTARLGGFILAALVVFGLGIFLVGDRQFLFTRTYRLKAAFDTVAGLDPGAVVRSGGVRVGVVDRIDMPRRPGEKVTVVVKLEKATRDVITRDSVASIETEGLLGAKYVSITLGTPEAEPVRDGDTLASRAPLEYADLAKKAGEVLDGTKGMFRDLRGTMTEAKAGVRAFHDNMEALKDNPLLRGFFKRRGYRDSTELAAHEIPRLPRGSAARTFVYPAHRLFGKGDTAKLKDAGSLDEAGAFLEQAPFGLAVVTAYTGPEGDREKNLELTQARATVVRDYLARKFRLDDARIKTKGMGEDTDKDSKDAARVAILVYPTPAPRSAPSAP